ncbi:MAG: nucleotide sugar dehydrogenase [Geminicoccaceae bacterium]
MTVALQAAHIPAGAAFLRIAVLGLGHVGATNLACLAAAGHQLLGIDVNPDKVAAVAAGRSPVVEPLLDELLREAVAAGRASAAIALEGDPDRLDLVLVCVGTPAGVDGGLDLGRLLECATQLGRFASRRRAAGPLLVVFRSTMPPGTMQNLLLPALEQAAGEPPGPRWEAACNPEFLREGTAVADFRAPPKIVIGERAPGITRRLRGLYDDVAAPLLEVPFAVAEMGKLVDNAWHALKVSFANEIGRLCVGQAIDPQAVAELLLADTRLNLSAAYLRPGGPFGGPCLPKDLAGLVALAEAGGMAVPVLAGAEDSNRSHLRWLAQAVRARAAPPGPILLLGLAFKAGTDDLRHSPPLDLARLLVEAGYQLLIHDPDLDLDRVTGANLAVAAEHRALLAAGLAQDLEAAAAAARLIVLTKPIPGIRDRLPANAPPLLDLTRLELSS